MGKRLGRYAELMGDNIIGIYLSSEPLCDSNLTTEDDEPKLRRFIHDQETIQNLRRLGHGEHGVVVSADIEGANYALKIFQEWKQPGPVFYSNHDAICITPLACECRAFARLDSRRENGTWAVRCYGWMKLTDAQFKALGGVVDTHNLSRWVVVKEALPQPTNRSHLETIYKNFEIPKRARIYPRDIRIENYRGSKIVDLSSTLTKPCPEWRGFWFDHFYKETINRTQTAPAYEPFQMVVVPVYNHLFDSVGNPGLRDPSQLAIFMAL
ncbi:hypothetical protein Z517_02351 [Fonsecaea pedrosoi CBS 271.37]|uniref:Unplaced genomic scaffold supercont1.2, whole genome shotgun sequence n=1 Tax=Fonsecaea pedrosoi CBS 271.37 TaxID=1442368 RepID=A0A0D2F910_9EURO|nr:uncharacterized protein Z517_02351 [Fonsecaea pedrosoi CBS 271.37]KIW83107.1 hypothetical protein Z517_02351 [Fonsecaea pedrosoi CBS 271.37]